MKKVLGGVGAVLLGVSVFMPVLTIPKQLLLFSNLMPRYLLFIAAYKFWGTLLLISAGITLFNCIFKEGDGLVVPLVMAFVGIALPTWDFVIASKLLKHVREIYQAFGCTHNCFSVHYLPFILIWIGGGLILLATIIDT